MFERYTERARRAIFFARYEASQRGTEEIDTPCLLLGIIRENKDLMARLLPSGSGELAGLLPASSEELARLTADVAALCPESVCKIATHVDMPLSQTAKHALAYAAEESERLDHKIIDGRHLLVGLLRAGGAETACLKAHGIELETVRATFQQPIAVYASEQDQTTEPARTRLELIRMLQSIPADRLEAAATLLEGLASGKFEATGTSRKGPFHFSFEDKAESA
jgi:ATP-dependent Clp protease ATP-binding subunit ClpC